MAPSAAELFKQATDKRARFADGQTGVSQKKQEITVSQLYLRSWWPHCMLKLQRMRTSKFWVCGWFFHFFWTLLTNNSIWPMVARMLAAKKGIGSRYMCVWCVQPTIFLCSYSPTLLSGSTNERMAPLNIERKNGRSERQNVKSSNDRFFCHDRFSQ